MNDISQTHRRRMLRVGSTALQRTPLWLAVCLTASLLLPGCSFFGSKSSGDSGEYQSASKRDAPLELPPDLTPLQKDDRFAPPDQANTANALRSAAVPASSSAVAIRGIKARLVRDGAQRWLAVDVPPEKAFEVLRDFWPSIGMKVEVDQPALGIVETGWQEKHARAPTGIIQRTLNLFLESLVSTGEQDKYRARVERTPNDTSEIFITHSGLEEVYTNSDKTTATWQPRPRNPELEAEMLQRLLVRFETGSAAAETVASAGADKPVVGKDVVTTLPGVSHMVKDGAQSRLDVDEPFDRAWRRVGLALDRGGFTVEDRDRTKGLYFVRYLDPDYQKKVKESRGLFARIFESDPKIDAQQFRVALLTEGERTTVRVQDKDGHPDGSPTGERILKQLDEQMR